LLRVNRNFCIPKPDGEEMTRIHIPGSASINVDDGGNGDIPILFVHSLAGNAKQWFYQLEHLRKFRRAIAFDLRGHGQSDPPTKGDYAIESLAKDIDGVVNALNLHRFFLVGHSLGGAISISYAGSHPQKVSGLLLADPSGDARKIPLDQINQFLSALQSNSYPKVIEDYWEGLLIGSNPAVQEKVMQDLNNTKAETVIGFFQSLLKFDPLTPLQRYKGKKLSVITHINDTPISLHNLMTDLPVIEVSGSGHWLQMDKPHEFNRILDNFLIMGKED
jgi:pimeloyl-ACP methyl ester carboxylesterase